MKLGSTTTDVLDVLTGKTPVQTSSAVSITPDTQSFLLMIGLGIAAFIVLLKGK
jgi:hypothetical protein